MKGLGITIEETAIMNGIAPMIGLFVPVFGGMVADKIGNFKVSNCLLKQNFFYHILYPTIETSLWVN